MHVPLKAAALIKPLLLTKLLKGTSRASSIDLTNFSFITAHDGNIAGDEATIFIHGYATNSSQKNRGRLIELISNSNILPGHKKIIALWDSGNPFDIADGGFDTFLDCLSYGTIISIPKSRVSHFRKYRLRAENYGRNFISHVNDYLKEKHPNIKKVNFVCHSLGGRLMISCLSNHCYPVGFKICDVLLMAAAAPHPPEKQVAEMLNRIDGRLINAYSKSDRTLTLNFDETCIGSRFLYKAENVEMNGFGHGDYWLKLQKVLDESNFSNHSKTTPKKFGFRVHGGL